MCKILHALFCVQMGKIELQMYKVLKIQYLIFFRINKKIGKKIATNENDKLIIREVK